MFLKKTRRKYIRKLIIDYTWIVGLRIVHSFCIFFLYPQLSENVIFLVRKIYVTVGG